MKLAFLIALALAVVVIRSPKDAGNQTSAPRQKQAFSDKLVVPALPKAIQRAAALIPTVYVAATAYDSFGIESDYSAELAAPVTNSTLSVAWDPSPSTNVAGYLVYWGSNSGVYSSLISTTNLTATFTPIPVQPSTQYFRLFAQVSTNGLNSFADASQTPFLTVTQVSGASGPPVTLWKLRVAVAVTNAP